MTVYAVKREELAADGGAWVRLAQGCSDDKPLPVHAFDIKVDPAKLEAHIRRFNLVCKSRSIGDIPMQVVETHSIRENEGD